MALYQIMYISTATGTILPDECSTIARLSARNNASDQVTGLLLFNSKRFLQVLEGPHDAVKRILTRVHADPRHRGVVTLREGVIDAREFGDWAMAFDDPRHPSTALKAAVHRLVDRAGPSTRAQFLGAAELHRAWA